MSDTSVSVVIPTYRRPDVLRNCVASLFEGSRHPDEVIIVGRQSDTATVQAIADIQQHPVYGQRIRSAWVTIPGHLPPVETGIKAATADIIAIIDDDVTVTHNWLKQMLPHFDNPRIGVVGGRTILPESIPVKLKGKPGQITWYGHYWGNLGSVDGIKPFAVDSVTECNWSWRRELAISLTFDPVLNYGDASMYGLDLTFQAQKQGYQILYDPQMAVYHHVAPRASELDRTNRSPLVFTYCRNYTYIMLKHLAWWRRFAFLSWWFLIGGRGNGGLAILFAETLWYGAPPRHEVAVALAGKIEGIRLWITTHSKAIKQQDSRQK